MTTTDRVTGRPATIYTPPEDRVTDDPYFVLYVGTTGDKQFPLVAPAGTYPTLDEAVSSTGVDPDLFGDHPQAGVILQTSTGAVWVAPVSVLAVVGTASMKGWM